MFSVKLWLLSFPILIIHIKSISHHSLITYEQKIFSRHASFVPQGALKFENYAEIVNVRPTNREKAKN